MPLSPSVPLPQIAVSVEGLPRLGEGEFYSCFFQDTETPASTTNNGVTCSTPDASSLPPISHGDGEYPLFVQQLYLMGQLSSVYAKHIKAVCNKLKTVKKKKKHIKAAL